MLDEPGESLLLWLGLVAFAEQHVTVGHSGNAASSWQRSCVKVVECY